MKTRREFTKLAALGVLGAIPFNGLANPLFNSVVDLNTGLDISIFSKHLQFLDYETTGAMAAEMGFSGVDLTVRPKGHVLPSNVEKDLPKAIAAIKKGGSSCKMITTTIENASKQLDIEVIKTAAKEGVMFYRSNWFAYKKEISMEDSLAFYTEEIQKLGELNKKFGIIGCYQNHAGLKIGGSFWEVKKILETVDSNYFGVQYDIRHATVEGGGSWKNGLALLQSYIKTIVLKDFKWAQIKGKWKLVNVPIGEGMVDFDAYFKLLKKYSLKPPVSLHLEYDLGGAEKGKHSITVDKKVVYDAMKKDLKTINTLWKNA
ncbi:sugar phosphate isomerase/epimerase [Maribacter vaceletii]|uniref:Sugar phosphate isomerase/epimerase n=1 Tax=Maribacter vaceletii TaxID=1206816 RepID=A0A495E9P9_9FLAO|nr:sugar phosphate isomerase/epimerase family protein [Maribacter vaceletii]RKR13319.1 sugar phosphate isomerase/epimerase [Maribacter vaceletii]